MLKQILHRYKKEIILILALGLIHFSTRLFHLTLIPIFTDEAIYIRWAEIARYDAYWRFISLSDGKQPLFVWLMMVAIPFFKNPLLAGRLVSVLTGAMSAVGLYFLAKELFKNKTVGLLAAVFYIAYPFAFVYDRMALMDSMVGTFVVWALFFELLLMRTLRLDVALILGMIMGGAMMTKSSGFFTLYFLPFSLILFPWQDKKRLNKLASWVGLAVVAVLESQIIYSVLRLSPLFSMIATKNSVFIYTLNEWLTHPWRFFIGNLRGEFNWLIGYIGWPVFSLMVLALLKFWKLTRQKVLILVWFAAPFVSLALFGRVLYPRFILFMTLPLLTLSALSLNGILSFAKKTWQKAILLAIFFIPWLKTDYMMATDPYEAPIPKSDKVQYLNDWPAGGGIMEVVDFFNQESAKNKIYVATEGTFGPLPYALEVFLYKNHNVEIKGFWPLKQDIPEEVTKSASLKPTYFVFNQTQEAPLGWPLKFIAKYQKGIGKVYLNLYQVINEVRK